jgi:hypothetical protein
VELIQRTLAQLPVPLQGLFVLFVCAGFGVMAFFAVYADDGERDRAWPVWLRGLHHHLHCVCRDGIEHDVRWLVVTALDAPVRTLLVGERPNLASVD